MGQQNSSCREVRPTIHDVDIIQALEWYDEHEDLEIERLKLEVERKELAVKQLQLDVERRDLEVMQAQLLQAPASDDNKQETPSGRAQVEDGEYLTMSTIREGMGVRVTDSRLATLTAGELKRGRRVRLPPSTDERLKSMRVRWNSRIHCGQVGQVLEVSKRSAKVSVGGNSFHWDLEVFDSQQKRFCHCGCDLRVQRVESTSSICHVCKARNPRGSQTFRCENHAYAICEYCNGKPTLPEVGSKVIRGPTWKWGAQDGQAYAEGTVCAAADVEGWFKVQWGSGVAYKYRGPPFQDVVLARENGLQGSAPVEDFQLDHATYSEDEGWHFYDSLVSIAVDDDTRKVAVCKQTRDATVVTQEVINAEGSYTFAVRICCASGSDADPGPITVGIVGAKPKGFSTCVIGNVAFKGSIGAMCMTDGGAIVHEGKIVGGAPGVGDGDVVSVCIQGGSCKWFRNGVKFHSCSVLGQYRFGVSLLRNGQSVKIHSSQVAPLDLNWVSVA